MFQQKIGAAEHRRATHLVMMMVVTKFTAPKVDEEAHQVEAHDPQVVPDAGRVDRVRERGVGEPAEARGAVRAEEAEAGHDRAEQVQPVGEAVEPREGDVRRAQLQRHDGVGETREHRRREHQQHDGPRAW